MQRTHLLRDLGFAGVLGNFLGRIPALKALGSLGSLSFIAEDWAQDTVTISGLLTLQGTSEIQLWDLSIGLGEFVDGQLQLPFAFTAPADPLRTAIYGAAWLAEEVSAQTVVDALQLQDIRSLDDALAMFSGDYAQLALQVGPLPLRLMLSTELLVAGRHVKDAQGAVIGVEPGESDLQISLSLGEARLRVDANGIHAQLLGSPRLELPPLMLAGTALALELTGLELKLDEGPLPAGMAEFPAEHGFDEQWRGLFAGTITLWNLHQVFPGGPANDTTLPASVQANAMAIDGRGLTGQLSWVRHLQDDAPLALERVDIQFDRSWHPLGASASGRLDLSSLGARLLQYRASLEFDPFAGADEHWRCDVALETTGTDQPLLRVDSPTPALAAAMGIAAAALGDNDAALLLSALAAGHVGDVLDIKQVSLQRATLDGSLSPTGLTLDIRLALHADIDIIALAEPTPLTLGSGELRLSYDSDHGFKTQWSLSDGLELILPLEVDIAGLATLERISLRRRNDGYLALELGMQVDGSGDLVIGGLPDLITLLYDPKTDRFLPPQFRRDGQELTLLVPGTLYAKGVLRNSDAAFPALGGESWGDALAASLTVYLIGNGKAREPADHLNPDFYLYALDVGLLTATRSDGLKALLLNGDLSFRPGLPLGASGVALYGLGLNYAQHAQPNATDGDYPDWFMRQSPQFSTHVSKWQPQGGHWGFGAAVTLGSQPDDGRSWNVAAGMFLLLPGPVLMITGKGSLFSSPPPLPVGDASAAITAPFAATVALDLQRDAFTAELAADLQIGAGNRNLLELAIPARIEATLGTPVDMELSVGRFMPLESRVRGKALSLFDISAYIMVTTRGLQNFPRDGLRLPPFAIAYGGSGALSAGFSSAIAELRLKVQADFDMGVSLAAPPLMVGQLGVEGSLVARLACIGIDMGLRTDLLVVAPRPFELGGRATLRVKLPWPVPDIRFSGSFRIGAASKWPDNYPRPEDPIAGVSLFPRPNGANVLQSGESFDARELQERNVVHGVPVDTGILIAFRAPVGNEHPRIGLVSTQADDLANPVWEVASSGYTPDGEALQIGWRHVLTDIQLRETGGTAQAVKAGWGFKAASGSASGGQGDRRELHLMAPLDAPVERRYGSGAEVLSNVLQSWRPCDPPLDQKSLRVSYSIPPARALQVVTTTTRLPEHFLLEQCWQNLEQHGLVQAADVRINYEPASLRTGGLYPLHDIEAPRLVAMPAGIALGIEQPLDRPERLLSLPVAVFTRQRDAEQAQVISAHSMQPAGRLLIVCPEDGGEKTLYFLVRNGVQLDLRTAENQRVTASPIFNGTLSQEADEVWQLVRLVLPEGSRRISAGASMTRVSGGKFFGANGALFVGASHFLPHAVQQAAHERQREATIELVDAVAADAASWAQGSSQGLLKPATEYELTLKVESRHARQQGGGALELGSDAIVFTRKVRFRTESDIAQPLLPRMPAAAWAPEVSPPWCVDTLPAPEGYLYRADPVEVRLADAVAAGRIAAHGRALQLQLEHESGELLSERADKALAETKKQISKLQDLLAAQVSAQPCLGADDKPLWLTLRQQFKTLLQPGRYRATLLAVDAAGKRPDSVLHEWRLRASRWETFSAHVHAHRVQVIAQAGSTAQALPAVLAAMNGKHRFDEALLETLLYDTLGHPPMAPSATPQVMAVLRADGCGWLLLDGPEPLLSASSQILLSMNGRPVAFSGIATNAARTRSLLCLRQPVCGALSLRLGEQGHSAQLEFTVPTLTEFLESP